MKIKKIAGAFAGLFVLATAVAGQASAAEGWVCSDIEERGAEYMLYDAFLNHGYRTEADAEKLVAIILTQCPDKVGEVVEAAENIGGQQA